MSVPCGRTRDRLTERPSSRFPLPTGHPGDADPARIPSMGRGGAPHPTPIAAAAVTKRRLALHANITVEHAVDNPVDWATWRALRELPRRAVNTQRVPPATRLRRVHAHVNTSG